MEQNKDLVKEAQLIVNNYLNRKRFEKLALEYQNYTYVENKKKEIKPEKTKAVLNYVVIALSIILVNLIIYAFIK